MSKDTGGPAFPEQGLSGLPNGDVIYGREGMTLRDYFAAKAMQGLLSAHFCSDEYTSEVIAATAYQMADAMLTERAK